MWFKRRKRTEQDHALSESLRSLQTLLSETGRREPSLQTHSRAPVPKKEPEDTDVPAGPRLSALEDDDDGHRAPRARPPEPAAPESGNRWRDLSLSFDAEPVIPRARRDAESEEAEHPDEPERTTPAVPDASSESAQDDGLGDPLAAAGVDDLDLHDVDRRIRDASDDDSEAGLEIIDIDPDNPDRADAGVHAGPVDIPYEDLSLPLPVSDDAATGPLADEPGDDPVEEIPMDDMPASGELDVEVSEPPEARDDREPADGIAPIPDDEAEPGSEADSVDYPERAAADDDSILEIDLPQPGEAPAEPHADAPHAADEWEEDQLYLDLESAEGIVDDIPTLTDAVYVPDASSGGADAGAPQTAQSVAPPGPAESPHEKNIEQCLESLRVRLQLMGLDPLSAPQEKELHDTLADFLEAVKRD